MVPSVRAKAPPSTWAKARSKDCYREKAAAYGGATGYIGCYGLLTLEAAKLTLDAYMMKPGVGPDDLVDTVTLTR